MNFFRLGANKPTEELPLALDFRWKSDAFVKADVTAIFARILAAVTERTKGLTQDLEPLLWDSCLKSSSQKGIITLLAEAMYAKEDLVLVYDRSTKVVRTPKGEEADEIKRDYEKGAGSKKGIFISFKNFDRIDMLKIYSEMEYCTAQSLWKSMNVSKALQFKIDALRGDVNVNDSAIAIAQAMAMAQALKDGKDILCDAKDKIETAKPDMDAATASEEFLARKLSKYTGMPASWFTGSTQSGLSDTGEAVARETERGLKGYFYPFIKPTLDGLFGLNVEFRSEDTTQLSTALEAAKTMDLISDDYLSKENKIGIVNKAFNLDPDSKGEDTEEQAAGSAGGAGTEKAQDSALNGAQVTSLVDIVARVASKEIPEESAALVISLSYLIPIEEARKIVAPAAKFEAPKKDPIIQSVPKGPAA